jgi:hypothetical protein
LRRERQVDPGVLAEVLRDVAAHGGYVLIRARGLSMAPAIWPGDELVLGPVRAGGPRVGDVVAWADRGRLVAHRVVEIDGETVRTAGDATSAPDAPVPLSALIAMVAAVQPARLRRIASAARMLARWALRGGEAPRLVRGPLVSFQGPSLATGGGFSQAACPPPG